MKKIFFISVAIIMIIVFFLFAINSSMHFDETLALWKFKARETIISNPASNNKYTFIRTENAVYAINNSSGEQVWKAMSIGVTPLMLPPIIAENTIVVPEADSRIAVFSSENGMLLWRSPELTSVYTTADLIDIEAIAVVENNIYVARFNWGITSYSLQSGDVTWEYELQGRSNSYMALGEDVIIIGSGEKVIALDRHNGKYIWDIEISGGYIGPIVLDGNTLIVTDKKNAQISLIDIGNRSTIWEKSLAIDAFEINCIYVKSEKIYISAQNLIAISKETGDVLWESTYTSRLECPNIWQDIVIARNKASSLFLINDNTGDIITTYKVPYNTTRKHTPDRGAIINDDMFLVLQDNYTLLAIDLENILPINYNGK